MDTVFDENCLVCQKHRGEIITPGSPIFENELIFIAHALPFGNEKDHYLGHIFIETLRHIPELSDLTEQEAHAIGLYTKYSAEALMHVMGMVHVYSFVIGDGVPHVHVHVIGRYPDAPREYWGCKVDEWPLAPRGSEKDIASLNQRLREYFQNHFQ
ncbi:MAG: HIT domain-containing protein [Chloroflexi bacterium]|nr:HIT domain-containing protein [Chloroflexota bacterium]